MMANNHKKARIASKQVRTNGIHDPKVKYVVFRKGKTVCLAQKGVSSKVLNGEATNEIIAGDTVSILSNGMSRVQIARISKLLGESGAKITIVNKWG